MVFAINIRADNHSADRIRALWQRVEEIEQAPSMAALGYAHHISLALYDAIEPKVLRRAMAEVFAGQAAVTITFDCIRVFDNASPVLWAAPRDVSALLPLHETVHHLIDPTLCRPHYRPGAWVPHCTLGMNIAATRRVEALAIAATPIEPFDVIFDVGDCLTAYPVQIIDEYALPAASSPRARQT